MHEMTIAQNILNIITAELKSDILAKQVTRVHFKSGKMNAIIPESLSFCFDVLKVEYPFLKDAELVIEETPLIIRCQDCGELAELEEPLFICPHCQSFALEIVSGKEMFVESVEIADNLVLTNNEVV